MDGRHENIDDLERIGSPIGGTPLNEDNNQLIFERKTKTIRQEDHSLTSRLPDATQPTINVLDPIQRLPPEISTSIIQHILPLDGNYSAQLLDLTSVSPIWHDFLLTTPVLWSEIYLDDRQHDFLATVAIFIHFSSEVALKVAIYDHSMNCWADLSSILASVPQRVTSLTVLETKFLSGGDPEGVSRITSAIADFFDHLGHPPQLQELAFVDRATPTISEFDSLDLPSTLRLSGTLTVPVPQSTGSSATPGRFFDIDKYNSFGPIPIMLPLFRSCTLSFGLGYGCLTIVQMTEEALSHLTLSSKYIYGHIYPSVAINLRNSKSNPALVTTKSTIDADLAQYGLERFTHIIGTSLCNLYVGVNLSQISDLVNFLRLLSRLEHLDLTIVVDTKEVTTEIDTSSVMAPRLRSFYISFADSPEFPLQAVVQSLRELFSVLTPLYSGVESLTLWASTWPFSASLYMESLRRLKYLHLKQIYNGSISDSDDRYDAENDPITLHYLERLEVEGQTLIHRLRTPNLLSLRLEYMTPSTDLECLGILCLRKLKVGGWSQALNPSDFPVLSELDLGRSEALKTVDILSFSSLRSIRLGTYQFTNPEGNHLCTVLLYYPKMCPTLQELHFLGNLDWDILILMLERRNFGLKGVKRIQAVTLPFVPFLIHQTLTHLLAGEKAVRPSLESISLEATREVLFDPTVPGCCQCLKSMVPGCVEKVAQTTEQADGRCLWTPDELYPELRYCPDTVPVDIRNWMDHRRQLVDTWKSSYEGFSQEFSRMERCRWSYIRAIWGSGPEA